MRNTLNTWNLVEDYLLMTISHFDTMLHNAVKFILAPLAAYLPISEFPIV